MDRLETLAPLPQDAIAGEGIVCDQAIFTSAQTLTAAGYHLVASSKGLRADEKQTITRLSPSHDSLCAAVEPSDHANELEAKGLHAVAWYLLPTGRSCLALTTLAGEEQSGRGGKRIYTLNLVFEPDQLALFQFNPFQMARAFLTKYALVQQRPPEALPAIFIPARPLHPPPNVQHLPAGLLVEAARICLDGGSCILPQPSNWLCHAEALFLGLPAPLRSSISFSVGLKYTTSRSHRLLILTLDPAAKTRAASTGIACVQEGGVAQGPPHAWLKMIARHWGCGDLAGLTRRTSRPFSDCRWETLDRVGGLFETIDAMPTLEWERLLEFSLEEIKEADAIENEIQAERKATARAELTRRLAGFDSAALTDFLHRLRGIDARLRMPRDFIEGVLEKAAVTWMRTDPTCGLAKLVQCLNGFGDAWRLGESFRQQALRCLVQEARAEDKGSRFLEQLRSELHSCNHPFAQAMLETLRCSRTSG